MTIRELLRTLWFGRWLIAASVVIVVFSAVFYQSRQETYYAAVAVVEIASVSDRAATAEGSSSLSIDPNPASVESREVATRAAEVLERPEDAALLASQVRGAYTADTTRVTITATTTDPQMSQTVANAFAAAYIEHLDALWVIELEQIDVRLDALRERFDGIAQRLAVNPGDPFAGAERTAVLAQYASLVAQKSGAQSLVSAGQIIDPANSALAQGYGPRSVLAVAALVGLLAGIGLAFGRRGLDMRVRSAGDASDLARVPVLAEIYDVQGAVRSTKESGTLPVSSRVASPFTESMRELRTAAQVALGGGLHPSIVVVTAADPDAPRSFLTANLAASWALSGRSTIALSGDLRRPQLDELLPPPEGWRPPRLGPDEPLIRPTRIPNLRVCILPDEEMDPADYLATEWARSFVEGLRERADMVVIDAPPVLAAADATILGGYADGAVVVASAGRTDREVLAQVGERLRTGNVSVLGVAFAGVKGQSRVLYASTYGEAPDGENGSFGPDGPSSPAGEDAQASAKSGAAEPTTTGATTGATTTEPDADHAPVAVGQGAGDASGNGVTRRTTSGGRRAAS